MGGVEPDHAIEELSGGWILFVYYNLLMFSHLLSFSLERRKKKKRKGSGKVRNKSPQK